jgi:hypothetical protein
MTVEDDRDNSPLEEQIFGVILLAPFRFEKILGVEVLTKIESWIVHRTS